jgi:hypothetical protein
MVCKFQMQALSLVHSGLYWHGGPLLVHQEASDPSSLLQENFGHVGSCFNTWLFSIGTSRMGAFHSIVSQI